MRPLLYYFAFALLLAPSTEVAAIEYESYTFKEVVYRAYQLSDIPEPIKKAFPKIPDQVRGDKERSRIIVGMLVQENGRVSEAFVKESDGDPRLEKACIRAGRRFRFPPSKETKLEAPYIVFFNLKFRPKQ